MAQDIAAPLEEEGKVTQAVIQPALSGAEVTRLSMYKANALNELASGYDQLGRGIASGVDSALRGINAGTSDDMARQGALAGRSSVTRDANGDIQVQPPTGELFGLGGKQYANAVSEGTQSQITTNLRSDLNGIAANNEGNPEGLKAGVAGYLQGHTGGLGSGVEGKTALLDARDYGQQLYDHALTRKGATDITQAKTALKGTLDQTQTDLIALAQGGMAGSDAFNKTLGKQSDAYNSLTGNPAFGYSKDMADQDRQSNSLLVTSATIQGSMATAFKNGGINAAAAVIPSIDDHPGASDADKAQLKTAASAYLVKLQASNKTAIAANTSGYEGTLEAAKAVGQKPPLSVLQDFQRKANDLGDTDVANRAGAQIAMHNYAAATSGLSPSQHDQLNGVGGPPIAGPAPPSGPTRQHAAYNYFVGKGWSPNASHAMVATLSGESGQEMNPNSLNPKENTGGIFGGSYGLANWDATRQANLVAHAGSVSNARTFNAQLAFVDKEARQMGLPITSNDDPRNLTMQFTGSAAAGSGYERPTVNNGSQRWANYSKQLGGQGAKLASNEGALPPASTGARVTWEDLKSNPELGSAYAATIAGDTKVRTAQGESLLDSSTRALQNNILPPAQTMVQIEQLAQDNPKLADKYEAYSKEVAAYSLANQSQAPIGAGGGQPLIDQARAAAVSQPDILQRQIVDSAQKLRDAADTQLKSNPVAAATNGRWIGRAPVPLDQTQPQTIPQHFADNAGVVDAITAREPDFSKSVVFKNEVGQFGAAMAGPATNVNTILTSIGQLPQDKRDATLEMPEVKAAILGAANSPDPQKKQVAFSFMDQVYRQDPTSFDSKFGSDGLRQLRAWQDVEQYKTPDQIVKDANTANDPATIRAQKSVADEADKQLKGVTPTDIANKMAPHWFQSVGFGDKTPVSEAPAQTKAALLDDYSRAYTEQYSKTGDATAADKYATERTALKWGPSDANGGRVMAFPPERSPAYPMVNGNQSYIGTQLADFATQAGHAGAETHLVPDATTEAEMQRGKAPGYSVVVQGNDGQYALTPGRFYANPMAAQAQANTAFPAQQLRDRQMMANAPPAGAL